MTHNSFATAQKILSIFKYLYNIPPPNDITSLDGLNFFVQNALIPNRVKICEIVKLWVTDYLSHEEEAKKKMQKFIEIIVNSPNNAQIFLLVKDIVTYFERNMLKQSQELIKSSTLLKKNFLSKREKKLVDFSPKDIAQELTIIDSNLFSKIQASECIQKKWDKENRIKNSPNIHRIIERSNLFSLYLASEILKEVELKHRVKLVEHLIKVSKECLDFGNYASVFSIIGALNMKCIYRLKKTHEELSQRTKDILEEMKELMDQRGNFRNLRTKTKERISTCVPYIGIFMSDFLYIQESNQDFYVNGLINFKKNILLGNILLEIHKFQKCKYIFNATNTQLYEQLLNIYVPFDENYLLEISNRIEQKQKDPRHGSYLSKLFGSTPSEEKIVSTISSGDVIKSAPLTERKKDDQNKSSSDLSTIEKKQEKTRRLTELGKRQLFSLGGFTPQTKL